MAEALMLFKGVLVLLQRFFYICDICLRLNYQVFENYHLFSLVTFNIY